MSQLFLLLLFLLHSIKESLFCAPPNNSVKDGAREQNRRYSSRFYGGCLRPILSFSTYLQKSNLIDPFDEMSIFVTQKTRKATTMAVHSIMSPFSFLLPWTNMKLVLRHRGRPIESIDLNSVATGSWGCKTRSGWRFDFFLARRGRSFVTICGLGRSAIITPRLTAYYGNTFVRSSVRLQS